MSVIAQVLALKNSHFRIDKFKITLFAQLPRWKAEHTFLVGALYEMKKRDYYNGFSVGFFFNSVELIIKGSKKFYKLSN